MRWWCRVLGAVVVVALLPFCAKASCQGGIQIDQLAGTGNLFVDTGRSYGGWFWMLGRGNNLLSSPEEPRAEAGIDSGVLGGLPLDPTPFEGSWLVDFIGDRSTRNIASDWASWGSDGCGDLNGNGYADPGEVLAVLVVDSTGSEYAMLSVGGDGNASFDLGRVNNGGPSAFGGAGNGVPMSPVARPKFGAVKAGSGGKVEVEVLLPGPREIPTFDDQGGGRPLVQGFHLLQANALLAEVGAGGGKRVVTATPGEMLTLRTIFGAPGDAGFFVDGSAPVPATGGAQTGKKKGEPAEPEPPANEPEAAPDPDAAAGATGGAVGAQALSTTRDGDGDVLVDAEDNCPDVANAEQEDADGDGHGDLCDLCPYAADPKQLDGDADGLGDVCDSCPTDPENQDPDADSKCGKEDNCPEAANPKQEDADGDATGDACDKTFDPFVVKITPDKASAARGEAVELKLSVRNRSTAKRGMKAQLVLKDAAGKEFAAAADPGCLDKVPVAADLEAGKAWDRTCRYVPPKEAAAGAATLKLEAKDKEKTDVLASATLRLTLR